MKKILVLSVVFNFLMVSFVPSAHAVTLGFVPSDQTVNVSDSVSVDLVVGGLGDGVADSVGLFDMNIGFNSAILDFTSVSIGSLLGDVGFGEALILADSLVSPGVINLSELSLLEGDFATCFLCFPPFLDDIQPSSFTLATLTFDARAVGHSDLLITASSSFFPGPILGDALGADLAPSITVGTIDVISPGGGGTPVPEPASIVLLGSGLVGLVFRKKFRKVSSS